MFIFPALFMLLPASAPAQSGKDIRNQLGEFMGIYLTLPERRHAKEGVVVQGNRKRGYVADIWYWRNLASRDSKEEKCNAFSWLLSGRGQYGKGAMEAFTRFPSLREINLRFFDIQTGTKLGKKKGQVLPTEKIIPYARVGVSKKSLKKKKLKKERLAKKMKGRKCAREGARLVDKNWFNEAYLGSRKR